MRLPSLDENTSQNDVTKRLNDDPEEPNMFTLVNMSTRKLLQNTNPDEVLFDSDKSDQNSNSSKLKRINRGYSARRYLRNLTKNWDQNLLDTFISDGKLNHETVYEKSDKSTKRKRVEEDLSLWPQAYRFDQSWISATIDMRSYKFLKAQEFSYTKSYPGTFSLNMTY